MYLRLCCNPSGASVQPVPEPLPAEPSQAAPHSRSEAEGVEGGMVFTSQNCLLAQLEVINKLVRCIYVTVEESATVGYCFLPPVLIEDNKR